MMQSISWHLEFRKKLRKNLMSIWKSWIIEKDINSDGKNGEFEQGLNARNENLGKLLCCRPQSRSHCTEWKVPGRWIENQPRTWVAKHLEFPRIWIDGWVASRKTRLKLFREWMGKWQDEDTTWWFVCENVRHVFHQVFVDQSFELQGFRILRCLHQCCIDARSNRWRNLWKYFDVSTAQDFDDSRQQWKERGKYQSTDKNFVGQARDKHFFFPTERHQSVYLQTVLSQFKTRTVIMCGLISFGSADRQIRKLKILSETWKSESNLFSQMSYQCWEISGDILSWIKNIRSLFDAMTMKHLNSMSTPWSNRQESSRNETDLTEKLDSQEHRGVQTAGRVTDPKTKLKKIARYLKGRQRSLLNFFWCENWTTSFIWSSIQIGLEIQKQGASRRTLC